MWCSRVSGPELLDTWLAGSHPLIRHLLSTGAVHLASVGVVAGWQGAQQHRQCRLCQQQQPPVFNPVLPCCCCAEDMHIYDRDNDWPEETRRLFAWVVLDKKDPIPDELEDMTLGAGAMAYALIAVRAWLHPWWAEGLEYCV
jgi:hypothetical protein